MAVQVLRVYRHDGSLRIVRVREESRPDRDIIIDADDWMAFLGEVKAGEHDRTEIVQASA